ncbi:MAG: septum formation initiator family protein [Gemmatimonadetes bacterium]|nr:septum formation initiator family protein [Gemmatimonadota bacterium]
MKIRRVVFTSLLSASVYYAIFGGEYSAFELRGIGRDVEKERAALVELEETTAGLQARADALENDPRTLETLARENFGMIRDGEVLYRFADSEEPDPEAP